MLDINLVRQSPDTVKTALQNRQKDPAILDQVIAADKEYRQALSAVEALRSQQNSITKTISGRPTPEQLASAKNIKEELKKLETKLTESESKLNSILEEIPNIPADDVPVGKDDHDNIAIKTEGQKPEFSFTPLDHVDLGEKLDIIDIKKASVVSGSRFGYFKNQAAVLEMAVMFYAFRKLTSKGWMGMIPPAMVKKDSEWKMGYTSNKNLDNAYYSIPQDDLIFISSSEHSVVPYHLNEILNESQFPLKYVNYSPCFRRESGTYGKDTRGLFRVHYFNKVEMNVFTLPDLELSDYMQQEMLAIEEELMKDLGLHYQVMNCCTGDLPQPNRRMFDINTWFPGQSAYRETQSCSNCTDYQARRLNTKVKYKGKNEYVHILNATLVTDRVVLAILENFQTADGTVIIPDCLISLTGFNKIPPKS